MTEAYQRTPDTTQIEWVCEVCHFPIATFGGAIWLPVEEVREASRSARYAEPRSTDGTMAETLQQILDGPNGPTWRITHWSCSAPDDIADGSYYIEVDRIGDLESLMRWTVHLMDKPWLHETDWSCVISRVVGRGV